MRFEDTKLFPVGWPTVDGEPWPYVTPNGVLASCGAACLVLTNRETNGDILKGLLAIEDPSCSELLAITLIKCEKAWKEKDLYSKQKY